MQAHIIRIVTMINLGRKTTISMHIDNFNATCYNLLAWQWQIIARILYIITWNRKTSWQMYMDEKVFIYYVTLEWCESLLLCSTHYLSLWPICSLQPSQLISIPLNITTKKSWNVHMHNYLCWFNTWNKNIFFLYSPIILKLLVYIRQLCSLETNANVSPLYLLRINYS